MSHVKIFESFETNPQRDILENFACGLKVIQLRKCEIPEIKKCSVLPHVLINHIMQYSTFYLKICIQRPL